jgi:tetratricopeptide (TPR) repeat protein
MLNTPTGQVIVVSGAGGMGKTALALTVAPQVSSAYPDGSFYINLRGVDNQPVEVGHALRQLLSHLGVSDSRLPEDVESRASLFRQRMADRLMLILLDNAKDHKQVQHLIPGHGCSSAVLITSRDQLLTLGAKSLNLPTLTEDQSLALLESIVGRDRLEVSRPSAQRLVESLGGLPLAIRPAGSHLTLHRGQSLAAYHDLLVAGEEELSDDNSTLRSSFDLTLDELTEDERTLFAQLSIATESTFDRRTFYVIAGATDRQSKRDANRRLQRLLNYHLVEAVMEEDFVSSSSEVFSIHDLILSYAREIAESEYRRPTHDAMVRLLKHHASVAAEAMLPRAPGDLAITGLVEIDPGDATYDDWQTQNKRWFRNLLLLALEQPSCPVDLLWRAVAVLASADPWPDDAVVRLRLLTDARTRCNSGFNDLGAATLSRAIGVELRKRGAFSKSEANLREATVAFEDSEQHLWLAWTLVALGDTLRYAGRLDDAISEFSRAINITDASAASQQASALIMAEAQVGLGDASRGLCRWTQALASLQDAEKVFRTNRDKRSLVHTALRIAMVYRDQAQHHEAHEALERALQLATHLGDDQLRATCLRQRGIVSRNALSITNSLNDFQDSMAIFHRLGDRRNYAACLRNRGDLHRLNQDFTSSTQDLTMALTQFDQLGDDRWVSRCHVSLAQTNRMMQDPESARRHLVAAEPLVPRGDTHGHALVHRAWGLLLRDGQCWHESDSRLRKAADLMSIMGDLLWEARCLSSLGDRRTPGEDERLDGLSARLIDIPIDQVTREW